MIDQETIQRIMDAARIEEVIGDFVSLKRRGANHIGCCPFHNEKTPSFYVSPSKGIYKCFGCGKAGNVITFLKEHEHYTYPEALQYLAKKYHIEVHEQELTPEEKARETLRDGLYHASDFAQKYFADLLWNNEDGRAIGLSYFRGRGMSDKIIRRFGLGYCLDEWDNFTTHAMHSGYSLEVLEKTGLTIVHENDGKRYDRFRGRVMFPIYNISGRVLGFSGRILSGEKKAAKYVNSPDSEIYNKSRILYGLYQARSAIAKADKCYLVEGNVDVVSMHQSGVENTVASCGTSLTTEQIRLIKRYTPNVTVLYDGDKAGIKAALRAVDLLFAEGMRVRLVLFPDGEDPDSYAQKYGSTALQEYLAKHEENFILFKTRVLLDDAQNDPIKRAELISDTAQSIALVGDLLERNEYIRQCAYLLKTSEEALVAAVGKAATNHARKAAESTSAHPTPPPIEGPSPLEEAEVAQSATTSTTPAPPPDPVPPMQPPEVERHLAQLLLNYGNTMLAMEIPTEQGGTQVASYSVADVILSELQTDPITFCHPLCQRIYEQCQLMFQMGGAINTQYFVDSNDEQLRTFATTLMVDTYVLSEAWSKKGIHTPTLDDNLLQDVRETLYTFKSIRLAQMMAETRDRLRSATPEQERALLAQLQTYGQALRQLQGARNIVIAPHYSTL